MPILVFRRDHLRSTSGIISGSGSFVVQFGDHVRSGDHLRSGIICSAAQNPFIQATVNLGGQYPSPYTLLQKFKFCGYVFENPDRYILHVIVNVFCAT